MTKGEKGSLTIFLALTTFLFLTFCLVLVEGTRVYFLRVKAAQALELAEFSVLSEYQQELFAHYGIFFLDLDYEQGAERTTVLEQRAQRYFSENAEELQMVQVMAGEFQYATDGGGISFFNQAVGQMKVESGYKLFDALFADVGNVTEETVDLGGILETNENEAESFLDEFELDISLPRLSFPSIDALTQAVFGDRSELSQKSVNRKERISERTLKKGVGTKESISFTDMQLFHGYLFKYCNYYGSENATVPKETLEYQLEYIISGKAGDRENLEDIMWRIFLLRAGANYLFFHQDAKKAAMAEAEAIAIVGASANPVLIQAVKEILLISQAIEEGIRETRSIFAGEKVPLYQEGIFSGIELGYEQYLYLFLNTTGQTEKIYRCMDIVELEVRKASGYESFKLDHCTDSFSLTWTYQFDSLFEVIPLMDGGGYEDTVTRKIYYEV